MMKEILDKFQELIGEITEIQKVYIGEPEKNVGASIVTFAIIDENTQGETLDYQDNFALHRYYIDVRAITVTPAPFVQTAIEKAIDLSDLVIAKIKANRTLENLVKRVLLVSVDSSVGQIGDNVFARARRSTWEVWTYESTL